MFLKSNLILIAMALISFFIIFFTAGTELQSVLTLPIIAKINAILILFSSTFIYLRIRDNIIHTKFNYEELKSNISLGIYYGLTVFGVLIAVALILM